MRRALHLTIGAQRDLEAIALWYEQCREGLGRDFLDAVHEVMERLRDAPGLYPEVAPGWRRALSARFPYGAYYRVEDTAIWVVAVLHLHREPDAWRDRG